MTALLPGIDIVRLEYSRSAVLGVMRLMGQPRFVTLEPPWLLNRRNASCIPTGSYFCERYVSSKLGLETFRIVGVPGRSGIAFHPGTIPDDTDGCVLLGMCYGDIRTPSICRSRTAFKKFMDNLHGVNTFHLSIQ